MRVKDLTEAELLNIFVPHLPQAEGIIVPTGDDCAVLPAPDGRIAVSTDMLVEGRHFRRDWSTGSDIGWRAAMQNLADSVAMGAAPTSIVVSISLPGDLLVSFVDAFARGLGTACHGIGAGVDGGDLVGGDAITVGVTVLGSLEGRKPRLRSGARPGEPVIHCGALGRSAAGLELLKRGYSREEGVVPSAESQFIDDFLRPKPPLSMALNACRHEKIGALMDVSDGLIKDVGRIARASNVWIDIDSLALRDDYEPLLGLARRLGYSDPQEWALHAVLTGGEDHGFLGTLRNPAAQATGGQSSLPEGFRQIGSVRDSCSGGRVTVDGSIYQRAGGWDHFKA